MAPRRRLLALALAPLLLFAATACSETPPQEKHVEQAVRDYYEALNRRDYRTQFRMLDSESRAACGKDHTRQVSILFATSPQLKDAEWAIHGINDIVVEGDSARALVDRRALDIVRYSIEPTEVLLNRESGRWRVHAPCPEPA